MRAPAPAMTFLDQLTEDQRNTIISLPYRVGLWVSDADKDGGVEATQHELQALSNIIHGFAEEMFGSETMQHIMSQTLAQKARWAEWKGNIKSVPEDCRIAVDIISEHTDPKDVAVFRMQLMEIGEAVAVAFHENDRSSRFTAYIAYISSQFGKKAQRWRARSFNDFLRISINEHKALITLEKALGAAY